MEGKNSKEIPIDRHYFITWCKVVAIKFFYDQPNYKIAIF